MYLCLILAYNVIGTNVLWRDSMRYLKDDEIQLATRFLFLSMAIVVLEKDLQQIQYGNFKIKEPYINLLEKMMSLAMNERRKLRKVMKDKQLQVVRLNKNDSFSSYLIICKGKEEKRNYFNPTIRKNVQSIIQSLLYNAQHSYPTSSTSAKA